MEGRVSKVWRGLLVALWAGLLVGVSGCTEPEPGPGPAVAASPAVAGEAAPSATPAAAAAAPPATPASPRGTEGAESPGLEAYATLYSVLKHPRCLNCHPSGNRPLQFDASLPHIMNVQRGPSDRGGAALQCSTCHQAENHAQPHLPPGSPVWRLAPREMAFEGRSPRALALQLRDPKQSHLTLEELVAHVRDDALVGWGWAPGPGRAPVPVPREAFVAAFTTWVAAGAPIPAEGSK